MMKKLFLVLVTGVLFGGGVLAVGEEAQKGESQKISSEAQAKVDKQTESDPCPTTKLDGYCVDLREPINGQKSVRAKDGVSLLSSYIGTIYKYAASIIGILCVLIIVISGVQISLGGANAEMVNQAKERIMQALLSLILLFGTGLLLKTINPGFFV